MSMREPSQELFSEILVQLRESLSCEVYDGLLPPEGTAYPFVYLSDILFTDSYMFKDYVGGNASLNIDVYSNDIDNMGDFSDLLYQIKSICRGISKTGVFSWKTSAISHQTIPDNTTSEPLIHGIVMLEYQLMGADAVPSEDTEADVPQVLVQRGTFDAGSEGVNRVDIEFAEALSGVPTMIMFWEAGTDYATKNPRCKWGVGLSDGMLFNQGQDAKEYQQVRFESVNAYNAISSSVYGAPISKDDASGIQKATEKGFTVQSYFTYKLYGTYNYIAVYAPAPEEEE